jgi:SAM-dependent methyltransferase|tara:strand:+ start:1931 stop:2701 length:771 start_codon:yes stop_codon:yes gene_type:complete
MIGNREEYIKMSECERNHWWYDALHNQTLDRIKEKFPHKNTKILDLGCGTGGLLSRISRIGYNNIIGFDISADAVEIACSFDLPVTQADARKVIFDLEESSFDVIVMHDVFYFFTDIERKEIFSQLLKLLNPGGLLMMNLPSFDVFAGTHDAAVGIQKRFNKQRINDFINNAPAIESDMTYWPFALSPVIATVRSLQRIKIKLFPDHSTPSDLAVPNRLINAILLGVTNLEGMLGLRKIWGSSIFLSVEKVPTEQV